jgi:hypothetical protein
VPIIYPLDPIYQVAPWSWGGEDFGSSTATSTATDATASSVGGVGSTPTGGDEGKGKGPKKEMGSGNGGGSSSDRVEEEGATKSRAQVLQEELDEDYADVDDSGDESGDQAATQAVDASSASSTVDASGTSSVDIETSDSALHSAHSAALHYVLWDIGPGEGFTMRKKALHRMFAMMKNLQEATDEAHASRGVGRDSTSAARSSGAEVTTPAQRVEWVLVLPTFRNRQGSQQYGWSEFFDVQLLKRAYAAEFHVIEAKEYFGRLAADEYARRGGAGGAGGGGSGGGGESESTIAVSVFFRAGSGVDDDAGVVSCPTAKHVYAEAFYIYKPPDVTDTTEAASSSNAVMYSGVMLRLDALHCRYARGMSTISRGVVDIVLEELQLGGGGGGAGAASNGEGGAAAASNGEGSAAVAKSVGSRTILLGGMEQVHEGHTRRENEKSFWHVRRHMMVVPSLHAVADGYISRLRLRGGGSVDERMVEGGQDGKGRQGFVAMHLRRGDFKTHHSGTWVEDEQVVRILLGLCAEHLHRGRCVVFVATDADVAQKALLTSLFDLRAKESEHFSSSGTCTAEEEEDCEPQFGLHFFEQEEGAGINPMQSALVEQLVAASATYFCGTMHSTFSLEVHYDRRVRFGWDFAAWKSAGGLLTVGADGETRAQIIPPCNPEVNKEEEECYPW